MIWRYQWWPIQFRFADHTSSKRRWWIEQGGEFPNVRYLATVLSLWRFRVGFGNRRTLPYTDHRPMTKTQRIYIIVTAALSAANLVVVALAVIGSRKERG